MKRLRLEKIIRFVAEPADYWSFGADQSPAQRDGKVTDTSGTELAGVTVLYKDAKSAGTITDAQENSASAFPWRVSCFFVHWVRNTDCSGKHRPTDQHTTKRKLHLSERSGHYLAQYSTWRKSAGIFGCRALAMKPFRLVQPMH